MRVKVEDKLTLVEMESLKGTFDCADISQFFFNSQTRDSQVVQGSYIVALLSPIAPFWLDESAQLVEIYFCKTIPASNCLNLSELAPSPVVLT